MNRSIDLKGDFAIHCACHSLPHVVEKGADDAADYAGLGGFARALGGDVLHDFVGEAGDG
jgi:hypothetical protein